MKEEEEKKSMLHIISRVKYEIFWSLIFLIASSFRKELI